MDYASVAIHCASTSAGGWQLTELSVSFERTFRSPGDSVELSITSLAYGGQGGWKHGAMVFFVPRGRPYPGKP